MDPCKIMTLYTHVCCIEDKVRRGRGREATLRAKGSQLGRRKKERKPKPSPMG